MAFIFLIFPYLETSLYPFTRALPMCFTFCICPFFHLPPFSPFAPFAPFSLFALFALFALLAPASLFQVILF